MVATQDLPRETLSALLDASSVINDAQRLEPTLAAIARAAAAVLRSAASSVILLDKARGKQVFVAAVGDRADQLLGMQYEEGVGLSGKAMAAGKAQIHNDVDHEKAHLKQFDTLLHFHTRSLVAAPMIHHGQVLGVVEVINPVSVERFGPPDAELAQIFANLAASAVAHAQNYERIARENHGLREVSRPAGAMLGASPAMGRVRDLIRRVAPSTATVLLLGESGTGKELAARAIHEASPRRERAFIPVNCAALPETLLESELFGHEAGSFTGATGRRLGRFELANEGTIFLDEIGELAPTIQVKLLRVLQEKEFVRVGGTQTIGCDVRVIAATNRDLAQARQAGRFREDLYYRLNVFPIVLPPLRQRREDIPALTEHFLGVLSGVLNSPRPKVSEAALRALANYEFAGNIRELQNILERACLLADGGVIELEHLPGDLAGAARTDAARAPASAAAAGGSVIESMERALVVKALEEHDWNQTRAAKALGISRDNLRYRMKKYGLGNDRG